MNSQTLRKRKVTTSSRITLPELGSDVVRRRRRKRGNDYNLKSSWPILAASLGIWILLVVKWDKVGGGARRMRDVNFHKKLRGKIHRDHEMKRFTVTGSLHNDMKSAISKEMHHIPNMPITKPKITMVGGKEAVKCSDGSFGVLNDDYCDCLDGSDEPNTSACSNILVQRRSFLCNDGTRIFPSRINDGVKDCPDGSDERI
eukprot:CAMPEP_0204638084 /NCGR_PEP_ID=MMETSP0717-20131115/38456_1 /ASSEMBLY_ACC=CAM_ASM_000666 /TAXON_ID=230516 /ORGANISM="Chaetoceros curvisetus" /LENGTH=200 /DNA_ID=CAMNT_0051657727 /DNA_START=5 /DNA_END=607 /DNA_ORIENTATION=+